MPYTMEFTYANPTQIVFGPNSFSKLNQLVPKDAKVLLLYGGGSIKTNGVYEEVKANLGERTVHEFSGVEPNPSLETLSRAVDLVKQEKIDFILGVGGGSVCDGAKFVACAACYEGDGWDIVTGKHFAKQALPVGIVLTLPATGSESNFAGVVTKLATKQKQVFYAPPARPRFALLNPNVMASLPDRQLQNGLVDAFVHACEQYLTFPVGAMIQDGYAETVMRTLVTLSESFEDRHDMLWQQNMMWAANQALSGILGVGVPGCWITHRIGVELTALWGIDHGRTLSNIQPALLQTLIEAKREKLEQMGSQVFGLSNASAEMTLAAIQNFYRRLDMPTHLGEAGITDPEAVEKIMAALREHGTSALGGHGEVDEAKTETIVRAACTRN